MSYFFKKIRQGQWLALRIPAGLQLDVGDDGKLQPVAPWRFDAPLPLPAWAIGARLLVLQNAAGTVAPALLRSGRGQLPGWQPFEQSRAALADIEAAAGLRDAMLQALENPLLPLRVYQAYRDFPAQPNANPASAAQLCEALAVALGGSATDQPIEAFSELLFFVDGEAAAADASAFVDDGGGAAGRPAALRVSARQTAAGVSLLLDEDGRPVTNGGVIGLINRRSGADSPFAPFFRWRRTLGIAERPSADSGAVLLPGVDQAFRAGVLDGVAWSERPLRLMDRLGAGQLAGELLNYDVKLFNPHGRCTHSGRVLIKRQRLDPPAAPLRVGAQLLPAAGGAGLGHCNITFALAAGEAASAALDAVIYRQDYPVVPTGFYGDDDDGALTVARSLGDAGGEQLNAASNMDGQAGFDGAETLPNLSNHNLVELAVLAPRPIVGAAPGQPDWQVDVAMTLDAGIATRLFVALRRRVDGAAAPESAVAPAQHVTGAAEASLRAVPHFERFWDPLPARAWLGEGAARVMEAGGGDPARPAQVRVVIDHAVQALQRADSLVGGYRLWMRDIAAPGEQTPFHAVALLQAVPPLVKLYAPIEAGRRWSALRAAADAVEGTPAPLPPPDFILLGQTTPVDGEAAPEASAAQAAARLLGAAGNDAALVLAAVAALRGAGAAREVVLSVAKRRAVEQDDTLPGNWVLFHDQAGNLLGRAIQFWFAADPVMQPGGHPAARYRLTETPSAQDSVALDDFGRVAWCWQGLADLWRHELEWMVEAVPRYAPINGERAGLGVDGGDAVLAVRRSQPALAHVLVLARRQPFQARFGLAQVLDAADDAFVIALHAPQEFRQALHNSVARTRQGVLRMHPARAATSFVFPHQYDAVGEALLSAWLDQPAPPAAARPPRMAWQPAGAAPVGAWGELVYDEPPCMALTTVVGASADGMQGSNPPAIGPLRRPRMAARFGDADKPALAVEHDLHRMQIGIPVARLDWWYSGASRPAVEGVFAAPAFATLGSMSLLRLPDPEAEMLLYFQFGSEPLRQVAHFRGSAFAADAAWQIPQGAAEVPELAWGSMRVWLGLQASMQPTGELRVVMVTETTLPTLVVARWRCQGRAFPPLEFHNPL